MDIEIGGETFHKEPNLLEQIAYRDHLGARRGFLHRHDLRTPHPHARFVAQRRQHLRALRWRVSAHIRLAMAEVFGNKNFRNEIIRIKCNPKNYTTSGSETFTTPFSFTQNPKKENSTGFARERV